jgi:hypothetical protein
MRSTSHQVYLTSSLNINHCITKLNSLYLFSDFQTTGIIEKIDFLVCPGIVAAKVRNCGRFCY